MRNFVVQMQYAKYASAAPAPTAQLCSARTERAKPRSRSLSLFWIFRYLCFFAPLSLSLLSLFFSFFSFSSSNFCFSLCLLCVSPSAFFLSFFLSFFSFVSFLSSLFLAFFGSLSLSLSFLVLLLFCSSFPVFVRGLLTLNAVHPRRSFLLLRPPLARLLLSLTQLTLTGLHTITHTHSTYTTSLTLTHFAYTQSLSLTQLTPQFALTNFRIRAVVLSTYPH